jgi:hypothetical protein
MFAMFLFIYLYILQVALKLFAVTVDETTHFLFTHTFKKLSPLCRFSPFAMKARPLHEIHRYMNSFYYPFCAKEGFFSSKKKKKYKRKKE